MNYEHELYHYGVKGMKWGVHKKRAVADGLVRRAAVGAGVPNSYGGGTKHQLSRAKKDLDILDNGGHLSIGITKKRQAAFDARDRARLEKKISSLEAKPKTKAEKKEFKQDVKDLTKLAKANNRYTQVIDENTGIHLGMMDNTVVFRNSLIEKKGKAYAENVVLASNEKIRNRNVAAIVGSAAVIAGAAYVSSMG